MHGYLLHAIAILFVHGLQWPSPWTPWSGIALFIFGTLLGPIALPWAGRPDGVVRALDAWDERGFRAWMQCGLLYGASLSWPLLFIPAAYGVLDEPRWLLLAPLAVGFTGMVVWSGARRASSRSAPRGQAATCVALFALLLPWCLALITTNPVWRFDLGYVESSTHVFEVHPGVDVQMHDALLWITGADIIVRDTPFGDERQRIFLRAPITICTGAFSEPGRMVMPSGIHQGAFYVPIAPDGSRLDDGPLDRLLARTRFQRFYVFALTPFLPLLLGAYQLRKQPKWRAVHAMHATVQGALRVTQAQLVATMPVTLHFDDGEIWTLAEGESLPMRFEESGAPIPSGTRLEFIFEGAGEGSAFRGSLRREALLDVRLARSEAAKRTQLPVDVGLQLLALHVSTLFAMWWVWSGV